MSGTRNLSAYLPSSPIVVAAEDGNVRVEWRHFFSQLWERTGGTTGPPGGGVAGVSSWNARVGAVTLTLADVTGVGGAPINNPTFTGTPAASTAAPGTNTTQLANTAFVEAAVGALALGITDGSNALPGHIGEYLSINNTTGLALANNTNANLAQFVLSPGDWSVSAGIYFVASSGAGSDELRGWTNTVSATQPDGTDGGLAIMSTTSAGLINNLTTPPMRLNLTASTTVYLSCWSNYGAGTMTVKGFMAARRMR